MVQYRLLQKKDFPEIRRVALESWCHTYRKIYTAKTITERVAAYYFDPGLIKAYQSTMRKGAWFCVATFRRKIIGYSHIRKRKGSWELFRIYILPSFHHQGIGSALVRRGENFLRSKKARKYLVYPNSRNKSGIRFYQAMGFIQNPSKYQDSTHPCFEKVL